MIFNSDTLVSFALIILFIVLLIAAIKFSKRIVTHIIEIIATIIIICFLFVWSPDQMTRLLRLDTFLKPEHLLQVQTCYEKVIDIRYKIFDYFKNEEWEDTSNETQANRTSPPARTSTTQK